MSAGVSPQPVSGDADMLLKEQEMDAATGCNFRGMEQKGLGAGRKFAEEGKLFCMRKRVVEEGTETVEYV